MAQHLRRLANARIQQQISQQLQRTMSSTSSTGTTVAAAPWREAFASDMESMKSPTFTLSSLHQVSPSSFLPRARTVVYRGMWASLQPNNKNPAPLNPASYQTDLPTLTTDARMEKVSEMLSTSKGSSKGSSTGSSKGGPIEAVFWATESKTQWRLRGRIYMIGPDIELDHDHAASVRDALTPHMRKVSAEKNTGESWSWIRELTAHFGNLSPFMRGTFRNPPPGTPMTEKPEGELSLGQKVEDLHDSVARENFRVLVIVPEEVDRLDLSDAERARRWNYTLEKEVWKETELWP
ncbi:hypothetical protein EsDP_00006843 [Epichloe bromicola]|uniref:Pyridoxamine 5'-phosphate oxidase Alr4036 family FMN-binding domain-containing protein n=1 Tax=Epichloe bromicola TaxID=79588 RepID=A0ABQ0CYT7_9HYPO